MFGEAAMGFQCRRRFHDSASLVDGVSYAFHHDGMFHHYHLWWWLDVHEFFQTAKWISKTQWLNAMDFYLLGDCNLQRGVTASRLSTVTSNETRLVSQWCLHYLSKMDQTIQTFAPNSEIRWTWYQTLQCTQAVVICSFLNCPRSICQIPARIVEW